MKIFTNAKYIFRHEKSPEIQTLFRISRLIYAYKIIFKRDFLFSYVPDSFPKVYLLSESSSLHNFHIYHINDLRFPETEDLWIQPLYYVQFLSVSPDFQALDMVSNDSH